jgi:uncharacterized protein (TIRG00374 family)
LSSKTSLRSRKYLSLFLGVTITITLLSWALRDVSWVAVWDVLKQAKWNWLILGWLAYLTSYCVRAKRWGTLLSATCDPGRYRTRLAGVFIGFGANSVLPAFMGEVLRATVPARLDKVPFGVAMGSVFAERLLDVGVVFLFLLIPLWVSVSLSHSNLSHLPLVEFGILIVVVWLAFLIGATFPDQVGRSVGWLSQSTGLKRYKPRITAIITDFLGGLSALKNPRRSLTALVETIIIWGLNSITFWTGLIAFGLASPGYLGSLFIQSVSALSITIPSTPGYVGPFEAGIRFALSIYNVPTDTAIAYGIALRFIMLVTIPVIAGIIMLQLGLTRTDLFLKTSPISTSSEKSN